MMLDSSTFEPLTIDHDRNVKQQLDLLDQRCKLHPWVADFPPMEARVALLPCVRQSGRTQFLLDWQKSHPEDSVFIKNEYTMTPLAISGRVSKGLMNIAFRRDLDASFNQPEIVAPQLIKWLLIDLEGMAPVNNHTMRQMLALVSNSIESVKPNRRRAAKDVLKDYHCIDKDYRIIVAP